jgi:hypothetical protein
VPWLTIPYQLDRIEHLLHRILRRDLPRATTIALGFPIVSRKDDNSMANFELPSDSVATIPIVTLDAEGVAVPPASGDTFTAVATGPAGSTAGALVATVTGSSLVLTPTVDASAGWTVVVSDADDLTSFSLAVDIVADLTPKAISLNVTGATFTPQPTPTAPGP